MPTENAETKKLKLKGQGRPQSLVRVQRTGRPFANGGRSQNARTGTLIEMLPVFLTTKRIAKCGSGGQANESYENENAVHRLFYSVAQSSTFNLPIRPNSLIL